MSVKMNDSNLKPMMMKIVRLLGSVSAFVVFIFATYTSSEDVIATVATSPSSLVLIEDSMFFEILWPDSLMYTYKIRQARDFGINFDKVYNEVEMIIADPLEGCQELNNDVRGAVVLTLRGECSFLTKTSVAERAGAIAVLIADNDESNDNSMIDMVDDNTERRVNIPSSFLLGKDGLMIRRQLNLLGSDHAIIRIPLNLTGQPILANKRPPWTLW